MTNSEHSIIHEKNHTHTHIDVSGNFSNKQLMREQNKNRQNNEMGRERERAVQHIFIISLRKNKNRRSHLTDVLLNRRHPVIILYFKFISPFDTITQEFINFIPFAFTFILWIEIESYFGF
jgi:hypothetical protein